MKTIISRDVVRVSSTTPGLPPSQFRWLMLRSNGLKVRRAHNSGVAGLGANTGDSLYRLEGLAPYDKPRIERLK